MNRIRFRIVVLMVLAVAAMVMGQTKAKASCSITFSPAPFAFETITVSTAAIAFTSATYNPTAGHASAAIVTIETNPIRWRADGVADPTASVGHLVQAAGQVEVCGTVAIRQFKMIRQGAADATASVTYLR